MKYKKHEIFSSSCFRPFVLSWLILLSLFQLNRTVFGHQEVIRLPKNRIHAAICKQPIVNARTNRILVRGMILPGALQYRMTIKRTTGAVIRVNHTNIIEISAIYKATLS